MKNCPHCNKAIPSNIYFCQHCSKPVRSKLILGIRRNKFGIIFGFLVGTIFSAIFFVLFVDYSNVSSTPVVKIDKSSYKSNVEQEISPTEKPSITYTSSPTITPTYSHSPTLTIAAGQTKTPTQTITSTPTPNIATIIDKRNINDIIRLVMIQDQSGRINSIAISHDSNIIASGGEDGIIRFRDIADGKIIDELFGHKEEIREITFCSTGSYLASGSDDDRAILWNLSTGEIEFIMEHDHNVTDVEFSPDCTKLVTVAEDSSTTLWDLTNYGEYKKTKFGYWKFRGQGHYFWQRFDVFDVAFSNDGNLLAISQHSSGVEFWNVNTWKVLNSVGTSGTPYDIEFSPDDSFIAGGSYNWYPIIIDVKLSQVTQKYKSHDGGVTGVSYSPDGSILATSSEDKSVRLWGVNEGIQLRILDGHLSTVNNVAFSPDGSLLGSASDDGSIIIWGIAP